MVNVTNVQKGYLDLGHNIATDFTGHVHRLFSFSYDRQKNTIIKCQLRSARGYEIVIFEL